MIFRNDRMILCDTGDPNYPYHPEFGNDPYYPKKTDATDEKMQQLYQKAMRAFGDLQTFMEYWTMKTGNTQYMRIWDEFAKKIAEPLPGIGGGRRINYAKHRERFNR